MIGKNVLNHKILVRKNVEYTIDLIGKNVVNYMILLRKNVINYMLRRRVLEQNKNRTGAENICRSMIQHL